MQCAPRKRPLSIKHSITTRPGVRLSGVCHIYTIRPFHPLKLPNMLIHDHRRSVRPAQHDGHGGQEDDGLAPDPLELAAPVGALGFLRDGEALEGRAVLEAAAQLAEGGHEGELAPRGEAEAGLGCGAGEDW